MPASHPENMLAVRVHRFGGPEELALEEISVPEVRPGEALVRISAAGVGPWDALVRTGNSGLPQTLPLTPGSDIAGIVERIDGDETHVRLGDAVYGLTNSSFTGGYAEYAAASLSSLARKPERLSFVQAASVPVIAVTAWEMLFDRASVSSGQTVVVIGSAGNVGSYAVQLARWAGARVIPISNAREGFGDASNVDVVVDTVGGATQEQSFGILKRGGMLVSSVSPPSTELAAKHDVRTSFFIVEVSSAQLERISQLIDDGVLETNVGTVLPLADAREAHDMLAGTVPHPRGKIVLEVRR